MSPVLVSLFGALLVALLVLPMPKRDPALPEWLSQARQAGKSQTGRWIALLRVKPVRMAARLLALLHRPSARGRIEMELAAVRMEGRLSVDDIFAMKALAVLVPLGYGAFLWLTSGSTKPVFIAVLMAVPCFLYPQMWLDGKFRRRREQLSRELPSFLNTLAVTVDAGLNLLPALEELSKRRHGVLAEEFRDALQAVEVMGTSLERAFEDLARRCDVKELSIFAGSLEQALRKGGSGISLMLREQAKATWQARKKRTEEIAQKASFKMFLPLLFLVVPALGIFMMGPALILLWRDFPLF